MTSVLLFYVILAVLFITGIVFLLLAASAAGKNKNGYAAIYTLLALALVGCLVLVTATGIDTEEEIQREQTEEVCESLGGVYFQDLCHNLREAPKIEIPPRQQ